MTANRPILVLLAGPSAVGKDTILYRLKKHDPSRHFPVTATTREPRPDEEHRREYFFIDRKEFEEAMGQGEFLETAEVHGNLYGTPKEQVLPQMEQGQDVILKVDVQGARTIRAEMPEAVRIFIAPSTTSQLLGRLRKRPGITEEEIQRRMIQAKVEMDEGKSFENLVVNREGCLATTVVQVEAIIKNEKERTSKA